MKATAAAFLVLAVLPAPLLAQQAGAGEHQVCLPEAPCRLASESELDRLRGGFDVDSASGRLRLAIGIHRAVSVNDRLVAVSSLIIPNVSRIAGRNGRGAFNFTFGDVTEINRTTEVKGSSQVKVNGVELGSTGTVQLDTKGIIVQNGPGNVAPEPSVFSAGAIPTIVQNTLDNQKLSTFTVINGSVNSLAVMKTLRMNDALGRAVAGSGR